MSSTKQLTLLHPKNSTQAHLNTLARTPTSMSVPTPLGVYAHLLPPSWKAVITSWLAEDTPSFDYGGFVVGEGMEEATLWGKSEVRSAVDEEGRTGC